ncbi:MULTISPECIES: hypothetical protein [unclassified Psychrobacter]|uniref:hypothetical protein n=1 Tax=unclassified Psychrobacter TaxID=196806 RepID=UPI0025B2F7E4|nr:MULTISPECIES: hypothetical protein [unclassified Psychrobacter]MDN3452499.1 hypothetical protein [Psychrobacter sp. APC 3350]MDN3502361.1 hypothetical protein [Psychrobacter sp. 5A.1]
MNNLTLTPLKSQSYYKVIPVVLFSALLLTACQKDPEPEAINDATAAAETSTQTTPVTTNINVNAAEDSSADDAQNVTQTDIDSERDMSLTELEKDLGNTVTTSNDVAETPNPEQAIKGAQITDVRYKNAAGETLSVVFETSASGMLNAIVTLPNKPKMTLSAPEGQGNNPTYQSNDGSIQLVSHAGGGTVDLVQNKKVTSFDAVSAEAEVITE